MPSEEKILNETPDNSYIKGKNYISVSDYTRVSEILDTLSDVSIDNTDLIEEQIESIHEYLEDFELGINCASDSYAAKLKIKLEDYLHDFVLFYPAVESETRSQIDQIVSIFGLTTKFESEMRERQRQRQLNS